MQISPFSLQMFYFFVTLRTNYALMEVSQRYTIAFRGLGIGSHDFRFEVGGDLFRDFENTEIKDAACEADVRLERAETMLTLDVAIGGSVVVPCDRCLEDCSVPVDFEGRLLVKFSDEAREYDGEVLWLHPAESEIDLTQYLYESVVLSLPYQRVHPEGGCDPAMLERFRIVSGEEFAHIEAQAAAEPSAEHAGEGWERLAALRERLEAEERAGNSAEDPAKNEIR